jgi:hypothetical protein
MPPPQANRRSPVSSANPQPSPGEPGTCVAVFSVTLELIRLTVAGPFMSIPPELPALFPVTSERISSRTPLASMPPPKDPEPAVLSRTVVSTSAAEAPTSMRIAPPSPSLRPLVIVRSRIVAVVPAAMLRTRPLRLPSRVAGFPFPCRVRALPSAKLSKQVPQTLIVSPEAAAVMAVASADAPLYGTPVRTFFVWHGGVLRTPPAPSARPTAAPRQGRV